MKYPKRIKRRRLHKERRAFAAFLAPSFIGVMIFVLLPFVDVIQRSFMTVMS